MSVNGSGANDTTSWTVKVPATGVPVNYTDKKSNKPKPAVGLSAADAFSVARTHLRRSGEWVVPIRT